MPDWRSDAAQPLTDQQITDVVAWLASKRTANPGQPYPTRAMSQSDSQSREVAGANAMDTIEQNTQDGQPDESESESVRSCQALAASFSVQAVSAGQRSSWRGAGGADHRLSSGAGDEEGLQL